MRILLLSNQLLSEKVIREALRAQNFKQANTQDNTRDFSIILYEPKSFYKINGRPVSEAKKRYFKTCLAEYITYNAHNANTAHATRITHITALSQITYVKNPRLYHFDFMDFEVEKEFSAYCKNNSVEVIRMDSPMFLLSTEDRARYNAAHNTLTFSTFYAYHREALNIFPNPIGGQWSYDVSNRNKIPRDAHIAHVSANNFSFPTNSRSSAAHLKKFAKTKLALYGPYQDAMHKDNIILWHSGLSPTLNLGLITPREVIKIIPAANRWTESRRASYEGFLRQLFWREYMALVYRRKIPVDNIFSSNRALPSTWYSTAAPITGFAYLDACIMQSITLGYLHHIERLMLVGNFMLLAQIKPAYVYDWFMVNFIDAHHWVMVGNVYHMLLYASGLKITKRPYIASSTYLNRMITGGLTKEETAIWDRVYAEFIEKNKHVLRHMYMTSGHLKKAASIKN